MPAGEPINPAVAPAATLALLFDNPSNSNRSMTKHNYNGNQENNCYQLALRPFSVSLIPHTSILSFSSCTRKHIANMLLKLVTLVAFFAVVNAEVVRFGKCNNYQNINCTISEVRITPCPEAEAQKPCSIKRGKSALVEFDFTPTGNYNGLETKAYWASPTGDLPWVGMDTNGCSHTTCPTHSGQQTFSYSLDIDKKFPARTFHVKWRLWKGEEMQCCFLTSIKLTK